MSNIRDRGGRAEGCRGRRQQARRAGEDVNPMNYISNLADAMLVLALGIMVALVLHWDVDLKAQQMQDTESTRPAVSFSENEIEDEQALPDSAQRAGEVYYDQETGTYYIVNESGTAQPVTD